MYLTNIIIKIKAVKFKRTLYQFHFCFKMVGHPSPVVWVYVLQQKQSSWSHVRDWGRDFNVDSFFSFTSVIKTMLEIEEIAVDDFSNAHNIYVKLRHEPPLPFKKNLHPYPLGRRVSDTNSWVKDRCFTPYNVIVYSIKLNFQQNLMLTHPPWLSCLFLNQTTSHQQNFIFARITQIVTKNTASSRNFQQYHVF